MNSYCRARPAVRRRLRRAVIYNTMITADEKRHLRRMFVLLVRRIKATGVKGVKVRTAKQLVVQAHRFKFKPSHWRALMAIIARNPSVLSLAPKLVAFRVVLAPELLETKVVQKRKEDARSRTAYKPPIGQKCSRCGDMALFVEFRDRSTGPGRKVEQVCLRRCNHCGLI